MHSQLMVQTYYRTVGTLSDGEEGITCSHFVAEKWGKASQICGYSTFEAAADDVKCGEVDVMLVPAAYPKVGRFIMDEALVVVDAFIEQIPSLVVVGKDAIMPKNVETIFYHPATEPLLTEVGINYASKQPATSNAVACKQLLSADIPSIAITNKLCSTYYGLNVYKVLRDGIKMPFLCFVRRSEESIIIGESNHLELAS